MLTQFNEDPGKVNQKSVKFDEEILDSVVPSSSPRLSGGEGPRYKTLFISSSSGNSSPRAL